jgi:hypothetical protein
VFRAFSISSAQLLEITLGDQAFYVALPDVKLAILR